MEEWCCRALLSIASDASEEGGKCGFSSELSASLAHMRERGSLGVLFNALVTQVSRDQHYLTLSQKKMTISISSTTATPPSR